MLEKIFNNTTLPKQTHMVLFVATSILFLAPYSTLIVSLLKLLFRVSNDMTV